MNFGNQLILMNQWTGKHLLEEYHFIFTKELKKKADVGPTLTAYSHIEPNRMLPEEFQNLEEMYSTLEYLHYTKKLSIQDIFTYAKIQIQCSKIDDRDTVGRNPEISYITIWKYLGHYNHLCDEIGWKDSLPDSLISSYNYALEASGLPPVIYYPNRHGKQFFKRENNCFICEGNFPCDNNGKPVLRWTGIRVKSPVEIIYDGKKSCMGTMTIKLRPDTSIYAQCLSMPEVLKFHIADYVKMVETANWKQIYSGPLNMEFNYSALKNFRLKKGMTQADLAEAIGATTRTYQKWESGSTVPDGYHLLRLMNWLEIYDVQELIKYLNHEE